MNNLRGSNSHIPFWDRKLVDVKPLAPLQDASLFQNGLRKVVLKSGYFQGQINYPPLPLNKKSATLYIAAIAVSGYWISYVTTGKYNKKYEDH